MAVSQRTRRPPHERRRVANKLRAHKEELIARAVPIEDLPDVDPGEAMQMLINRVTFLLRAAAAESERLKPGLAKNQSKGEMEHEQWISYDEQGNVVVAANYWIERESELRKELFHLTEKAQVLGLSERRTRVQETQMAMLGEALQAACVAAGLSQNTQRRLGSALRTELATIEGTAVEL